MTSGLETERAYPGFGTS